MLGPTAGSPMGLAGSRPGPQELGRSRARSDPRLGPRPVALRVLLQPGKEMVPVFETVFSCRVTARQAVSPGSRKVGFGTMGGGRPRSWGFFHLADGGGSCSRYFWGEMARPHRELC